MFLASSPRRTYASSYKNSSVSQMRLDPNPIPSPQNPSVCAEERKFRRNRASDCLSEASSSSTPAGLSTAGCPQRSGGTQTVGSPFFCLLFFGEAKKSESPAAATERHQDLAMCMLVQSKTNSGSGVFGVRAQISFDFVSPFGCFAGKL